MENRELAQRDERSAKSPICGSPCPYRRWPSAANIWDKGQQHLPGDEASLIGEQRASGDKTYYLANLPAATDLRTLAATIKARWICEQAHQQLKEELGLDHFEGRSWQGLHRHALMTMIAYAFLQHRRLAHAGRKKRISGPPPQPTMPTVRRANAEGLSFKKTLRPAEQDRPDVARKRLRWKAHQGRIDASRLVFIDETWIKTNMAPLRGWGPSGQRLIAAAPFGHWKTMTFIAALRHDRISAPWVIDSPINGELFTLYVEKVLAPTLAPGEIVILDNLGSHKGKAAREAIRARGAHRIFLPPYSPDLHPIEQVFAKLKHLIRVAQPRDVEATWRKVGELLDLFSEEECANYFKNSGYVSV
jgi:transposase